MTISLESIVIRTQSDSEAEQIANEAVNYLIKQRIINPTPIESPFPNTVRYEPAENARSISNVPNNPIPFHLDVTIGKSIYDTGELGFKMICPSCNSELDESNHDWAAAANNWYENDAIEEFQCDNCLKSFDFRDWFSPQFGFGNLAFSFHEWWITADFYDRFTYEIGKPTTWVKTQY